MKETNEPVGVLSFDLGDKILSLLDQYSATEQANALKYIIEKLEKRMEERKRFHAQVLEFLKSA